MNPHEILAELDRLGITVWYARHGAQLDYQAQIRHKATAPSELARAISENREALIRVGRFEPTSTPGIYARRPRPPGGAE